MAGKKINPEVQQFLDGNCDIAAIDCIIADINGCLRGKRVRRDALAKIYSDGVCLPGSLYALDITGTTVEAPSGLSPCSRQPGSVSTAAMPIRSAGRSQAACTGRRGRSPRPGRC